MYMIKDNRIQISESATMSINYMVCPLQAKAELQSPRLSLTYFGLAYISTYGSLTSLKLPALLTCHKNYMLL